MPTPEERQDDLSYRPIDNQNMNASVDYNPNRKLTADDYMKQFFSSREKAPVFDQAKADRLQRMSRINGIGRGLNVIGDIVGTAIGANVRQRNPDQITPSLFARYQDMMDKYKSDTDAWKYRDFSKTLQNAQLGIQRADKEEAIDMAKQKQADWMKAKTADRELEYYKWSKDWDFKNKEFEERKRANKAKEAIDAIKANKPTLAEIKETRPVLINTKSKQYSFSPEEASLIRDEALKNEDVLKNRYHQWYKPSTEMDMSTGKMVSTIKLDSRVKDQDLIRAMLEIKEDEANKENTKSLFNSPQFKSGEKAALDARRATQQSNRPTFSGQTQPKATKTIDYSTLNF